MNNWLMLPSSAKAQDVIWLMVFLAFLAVVVVLVSKLLKLKPKKITSKDGTTFDFENADAAIEGTWPSLLHHRFFQFMSSAESPGFFYFDGSDKGLINETFLRLKFSVFKKGITDYVARLEKTNGESIGALPDIIQVLVREYESKSINLKIALNNDIEICGVPKSYMKKFNVWHLPHAKLVIENVTNVLADRLYPSWQSRCAACLEHLYFIFQITIEDGMLTLPQLNGDLDEEIVGMHDSCNQ